MEKDPENPSEPVLDERDLFRARAKKREVE